LCEHPRRRVAVIVASNSESEMLAQQMETLRVRLDALELRLADIDRVINRLEGAALTTARSLQEISAHWDNVYEAMRRTEDDPDVGQLDDRR
jgi:uncharacterized coiled-coil protein SlyX